MKTWVEIAWQRQARIGHKREALIDLLTERGIVSDEDLDRRVKGAKGQEAELFLRRLDAELFLRQEEKPRRGDPT